MNLTKPVDFDPRSRLYFLTKKASLPLWFSGPVPFGLTMELSLESPDCLAQWVHSICPRRNTLTSLLNNTGCWVSFGLFELAFLLTSHILTSFLCFPFSETTSLPISSHSGPLLWRVTGVSSVRFSCPGSLRFLSKLISRPLLTGCHFFLNSPLTKQQQESG